MLYILVKKPEKITHISEISKKMTGEVKTDYFDELKLVGFDMFYGEEM